MHKLITGYAQTDHVNGNGLDNRRKNLRPATTQQNHANMGPRQGHSSQFKGVKWDAPRNKWLARITINYKQYNLGRYDSEKAAAQAYNQAAREAFGEYAQLNVLDD